MENFRLFEFIRRTSFLKFFLSWVISIFIFALIYLAVSIIKTGILVNGELITAGLIGLFQSIYASFLVATLFGTAFVQATGVFQIILYVQLALSILLIFILIDKMIQKWVIPLHHSSTHQDKKINTTMLMLSIFRHDVDKLIHTQKSKEKPVIEKKEIEATIDGLYVAFLDIEKLFSEKNEGKPKIKKLQYVMILSNIEDSLDKLSGFIDFLDHHNIEWKDKSVEFWLGYILETADKIIMNVDTTSITNPKTIITIENIKQFSEDIEKKL